MFGSTEVGLRKDQLFPACCRVQTPSVPTLTDRTEPMRHYPRNSSHAAARLVALTMIADGNVCRSEVDAVRRLDAEATLGLSPGGMGGVLQALCEDLLSSAQMHGSLTACIDGALLDSLIHEVDDPALQRKITTLIAAAAAADGHLSDGEQCLLDALQRCWTVGQSAATEPACA